MNHARLMLSRKNFRIQRTIGCSQDMRRWKDSSFNLITLRRRRQYNEGGRIWRSHGQWGHPVYSMLGTALLCSLLATCILWAMVSTVAEGSGKRLWLHVPLTSVTRLQPLRAVCYKHETVKVTMLSYC